MLFQSARRSLVADNTMSKANGRDGVVLKLRRLFGDSVDS